MMISLTVNGHRYRGTYREGPGLPELRIAGTSWRGSSLNSGDSEESDREYWRYLVAGHLADKANSTGQARHKPEQSR